MASDFELAVMKELGDIKSLATEAASAAKAANDAAVTATQAMSDRLFHEKSGVITIIQNDISKMEAEKIRDDKWERIHNVLHYSMSPALVFIHGIARHFGIDI
jgi:hypothetical protein